MTREHGINQEGVKFSGRTFDVITYEQVQRYKDELNSKHGMDVSDVSVDIVRPGDGIFDREEIKFKYLQHSDKPAYEELGQLLGNSDNGGVPVDQLKAASEKAGIVLDGKLPGFALITEDNRIVFLAVQEEDAIPMAQKYSEKEGDKHKNFATIEEAKAFLQGLGEKVFLHELGHFVYSHIAEKQISNWSSFVDSNPDLQSRVRELQRDKYETESDIPVAEEAFADYFIDAFGGGRIKSRLIDDPQAVERVRKMIVPV